MASNVPQPDGDGFERHYNRKFGRFSLQNNVYCVPVDRDERERLKDLDNILHRLFLGRPVLCPFRPNDGGDEEAAVLDCGFGTGAWIDHLIDEFGEDLDVTGVDIFLNERDENDDDEDEDGDDEPEAVQEFHKKRWNLNARFRDDQSEERLGPESFDLINSRLLSEGINTDRWQMYIRELKQLLTPGGWLQMVEIQFPFQSSNGKLPENSRLLQWWREYSSALQQMGKNARIGRDLHGLLTAEGFSNVQSQNLDLPIGEWDTAQSAIGKDNLDNVDRMLESSSLWPLLRIRRMSRQAYDELIAGARAELRESTYKLYYKVHVVFGQRPERSERRR